MITRALLNLITAWNALLDALFEWEIQDNVSVGGIIIWYLCMLVLMWVLAHIITGNNGGKAK